MFEEIDEPSRVVGRDDERAFFEAENDAVLEVGDEASIVPDAAVSIEAGEGEDAPVSSEPEGVFESGTFGGDGEEALEREAGVPEQALDQEG